MQKLTTLLAHGARHFFLHRLGWRVAVLSTAVLAGCAAADLPSLQGHPPSEQKRVRSVHHWDVLAADIARQVSGKTAHWPVGEHPIFVVVQGHSAFDRGFRQLLITHLVDQGVTLALEPSPVTLQVLVQVVQHPSGAGRGAAQWLAQGDVAVARGAVPAGRDAVPPAVAGSGEEEAPMNADGHSAAWLQADAQRMATSPWANTSPLAMGGAVRAPDAQRSDLSTSDGPLYTEVLITTSLESGTRYLARSSDVYYLAAQDATAYGAGRASTPTAARPVAAAVQKNWQVVAP